MSEEKSYKQQAASDKQENLSALNQASQSQIIDDKPETTNMEVQKHPHHVTRKKKWGEYFLEFFLLFLAVFLGFVAENFREHQAEHQRERQFMHSMIKDLEQDASNIQRSISDETRTISIADSLIQMFSNGNYSNTIGRIYYSARDFATIPNPFYITDGTLMQLKNSGGLRLIRKQKVVDSLQEYYNAYQWIKTGQDLEFQQVNEYRSSMMQIFDVRVFNSMVKSYPELIMPVGNPPLLNTASSSINEFLMRAHFCKRNKLANRVAMISLRERMTRLIAQIKEEYHLD